MNDEASTIDALDDVSEHVSLATLLGASVNPHASSSDSVEVTLQDLELAALGMEPRERANSLEASDAATSSTSLLKPSPISALKMDPDARRRSLGNEHNESVDIELEQLIKESEALCCTPNSHADESLEKEVNELLNESIQLGRSFLSPEKPPPVKVDIAITSPSDSSSDGGTDDLIDRALQQATANAPSKDLRNRIAERSARRARRQNDKLNDILSSKRWTSRNTPTRRSLSSKEYAERVMSESPQKSMYATALRESVHVTDDDMGSNSETASPPQDVKLSAPEDKVEQLLDGVDDVLKASEGDTLTFAKREEARLKALGNYFAAGETFTRIQNRKMSKMRQEIDKQYVALAARRKLSSAYSTIGLDQKNAHEEETPTDAEIDETHPLISEFKNYLQQVDTPIDTSIDSSATSAGCTDGLAEEAPKARRILLKVEVQKRRMRREEEFKQSVLEKEANRKARIKAKSKVVPRRKDFASVAEKQKSCTKRIIKRKKKVQKNKKKKDKKKKPKSPARKMFIITVSKKPKKPKEKKKKKKKVLKRRYSTSSNVSVMSSSDVSDVESMLESETSTILNSDFDVQGTSDNDSDDVSGFVEYLPLDATNLNFSNDQELEEEFDVSFTSQHMDESKVEEEENAHNKSAAPAHLTGTSSLMNDTLLPPAKPSVAYLTGDLLSKRPGHVAAIAKKQNLEGWPGQVKIGITEVNGTDRRERLPDLLQRILSSMKGDRTSQQQTQLYDTDPLYRFVADLIEVKTKGPSFFTKFTCERVMQCNLSAIWLAKPGVYSLLYYVTHPQVLLDVAFHGMPPKERVVLHSHLGAASKFYKHSSLFRSSVPEHRFRVMLVLAKNPIRVDNTSKAKRKGKKKSAMEYRGDALGRKYHVQADNVLPLCYVQYTMQQR